MRKWTVVFVVIAGVLLATGLSLRRSAAASTPQPQAFVVAQLPEIGTVYERTYCSGTGPLRFALGIRYLKTGQSGVIRFRAGRFSRNREGQPGGHPTTWFPRTRTPALWLAAAAGGENGVVVGWVRVIGHRRRSDTCESSYDPLRVTVQIYPRESDYNRNSWRYLRRLIG